MFVKDSVRGLFTTILFNDSHNGIVDIYQKLLSDSLPADLGYLYENVVDVTILERLSDDDSVWQKFGPAPRIPSCMQRTCLLSIDFLNEKQYNKLVS